MIRALRVVALLESLSFLVLLVGSTLKRTTGPDLVPVLGPVHAQPCLSCGRSVSVHWAGIAMLVPFILGGLGASARH